MAFIQDLRYALRGVAQRPSLFIATTATLTLGIGANGVMFGVVDQLLLRPPAHVANAGELRQVYLRERTSAGSSSRGAFETTRIPWSALSRERAVFP
jgi:hypothetical protein